MKLKPHEYRKEIVKSLYGLIPNQLDLFKRIYAYKLSDDISLEEMVNRIEDSKLEWALLQINNSFKWKRNKYGSLIK